MFPTNLVLLFVSNCNFNVRLASHLKLKHQGPESECVCRRFFFNFINHHTFSLKTISSYTLSQVLLLIGHFSVAFSAPQSSHCFYIITTCI